VSALRFPPVLAAWAQVAAALVNTRPRPTDPPEKLVGLADLERLLAGCPEPAPAPATSADLRLVRALRPALLRAFEAGTEDELADALNPLFARAPAGRWRRMPRARGRSGPSRGSASRTGSAWCCSSSRGRTTPGSPARSSPPRRCRRWSRRR
jgi:hypothetical protein